MLSQFRPSSRRFFHSFRSFMSTSNEHENRVRVGITDYAQKALGDLVYVELPKVGSNVKKGDVVGVAESVKGASDIYAPLSGKIHTVNNDVANKPSIVNKEPESDGWLIEIDLSEKQELEQLLDSSGYDDFCKGLSS